MDDLLDRTTRGLSARLPDHPTARYFAEFLAFGARQAWACLFGGVLLVLILLSRWAWPPSMPIARYDALFVVAVAVQLLLLMTRLEQPKEAVVILIFHLVGTAMELFKTQAGSWAYPEDSLLRIGQVPLFSGFMYAAVGSYMARVVRVFDIRLEHYPSVAATGVLALAIYANFFAHHFMPDLRAGLFAATAMMFWRVRMHYRIVTVHRSMPLLLAFLLVALLHLVCREPRHVGEHLALPRPTSYLEPGVDRQTRLVVPVDDRVGGAGHARACTQATRRRGRRRAAAGKRRIVSRTTAPACAGLRSTRRSRCPGW